MYKFIDRNSHKAKFLKATGFQSLVIFKYLMCSKVDFKIPLGTTITREKEI